MKRKKKTDANIVQSFQEGAASLFLILMVGLFPLYYQNYFFDINDAKLSFFRTCAIGLLAVEVVLVLFGWLHKRKEMKRRNGKPVILPEGKSLKEFLAGMPISTWFAVMFVLAIIISTVFSVYPKESFWGTDGRKLGAIVFFLCISTYVLLGRYLKFKKWMIWIFLGANAIVFLLAGLNFWGIDILHMYDYMLYGEYRIFISTIGNTNACASYAGIVLPIGMVLYYLAETVQDKIIYGAFLVVGFYGAYATNADSWILGAGAAFLAMLWFSLTDHEHMERFFELCLVFVAASLLLRVTILAGTAGGTYILRVAIFEGLTLQSIMTNGYLLLAAGIVFCLLIWGLKNAGKRNIQIPYQRIKTVFFSLLAAAVVIMFVLFLIANWREDRQWEGAFAWLGLLKLQDNFGSDRGMFWKQTVKAWKQLPIGRKFFGYGVNCFHQFLYKYQGQALRSYPVRIIDPHNEFLLFVCIIGIWGAVAYFGLLVSTLVESVKAAKEHPAMMVGAVTLLSFLAQGLVNNPIVFITSNLFLFLGVLKGIEREYKGKG